MERKEISKSAPSLRRRDSTKKDKSSTMKEINIWINKGNNETVPRACSRGVSTLTENVTEERMLYSRQLELGRERYKFLTNHAYEKHKFMERRQLKEKMMNQFMASARKVIEKTYAEKPKRTLTIRIPQMEDNSAQSSSAVGEELSSRAESRISRVSSKAGKKGDFSNEAARLESNTSRKSRVMHKFASKTPLKTSTEKSSNVYKGLQSASRSHEGNNVDKVRNKYAKTETEDTRASSRAFYVNTSNTSGHGHRPRAIKTNNWLPSVLVSNNQSAKTRKSAVNERSRSSSPTKSVRYAGISAEPTKSGIKSEPSTPKWAQSSHRLKRFGEKFDTSVNDPRYVALTSTLMRVSDIKKPPIGVKDIIEKNEVFKCVSKSEDAAHAKQMHAKFIALLLENEFK